MRFSPLQHEPSIVNRIPTTNNQQATTTHTNTQNERDKKKERMNERMKSRAEFTEHKSILCTAQHRTEYIYRLIHWYTKCNKIVTIQNRKSPLSMMMSVPSSAHTTQIEIVFSIFWSLVSAVGSLLSLFNSMSVSSLSGDLSPWL